MYTIKDAQKAQNGQFCPQGWHCLAVEKEIANKLLSRALERANDEIVKATNTLISIL